MNFHQKSSLRSSLFNLWMRQHRGYQNNAKIFWFQSAKIFYTNCNNFFIISNYLSVLLIIIFFSWWIKATKMYILSSFSKIIDQIQIGTLFVAAWVFLLKKYPSELKNFSKLSHTVNLVRKPCIYINTNLFEPRSADFFSIFLLVNKHGHLISSESDLRGMLHNHRQFF